MTVAWAIVNSALVAASLPPGPLTAELSAGRWGFNPRLRLALCATAVFAVEVAGNLHFVPHWLTWPLDMAVWIGYVLSLRDRGGPPRRRLRSALKRARSWLASGIPARRVTA